MARAISFLLVFTVALACTDDVDGVDTSFPPPAAQPALVRLVSVTTEPMELVAAHKGERPLAASFEAPTSSGFLPLRSGVLSAWAIRDGRTLAQTTVDIEAGRRATVLAVDPGGTALVRVVLVEDSVVQAPPDTPAVRVLNALGGDVSLATLGSQTFATDLSSGDASTWLGVVPDESNDLVLHTSSGVFTASALALPPQAVLTFIVFEGSTADVHILVLTEPSHPDTAVSSYILHPERIP